MENKEPHHQSNINEKKGEMQSLPKLSPDSQYQRSQDLIKKLENKLGGKVLSYFTVGSMIDDDVKFFYNHLKEIGKQDRIFFILTSSGGDPKAAYRIAYMLKKYCNNLVVVIPEISASAATMLSLAGEEIIMTPMSYLTAVDASLVHALNPKDARGLPVSIELEQVDNVISIMLEKQGDKLEVYKTLFNYLHPIALGAMKRSSKLSEMICKDILCLRKNKLPEETTNSLIRKLNHDYPAHGYPITINNAKNLGLNISESDEELSGYLSEFLHIKRMAAQEKSTKFTDNIYHRERYETAIESLCRRSLVHSVLEEKLDLTSGKRITLKKTSKWFSTITKNENGKDIISSFYY